MSGFWNWWQHLPSHMDPTIFTIGNFPIRWYGTMYAVAFTIVYFLVKHRIQSEKLNYRKEFLGDALMYAILGVMLGGRIGYVLFYNFPEFLHYPWRIISPFAQINGHWTFIGISGMSYHGGVLGVIVGWWLFARKNKMTFWELADLFIPAVPLGYFFGRIGNFINGELYGRLTDANIGMYFPSAPDGHLRYPSQLYEAFFEGIILFLILWPLRKKSPFPGFLGGAYIFGYGIFRFSIEYFRQPDAQLGFVFLSFSMGQMLSFAMLVGAGFYWYISYQSYRRQASLAK